VRCFVLETTGKQCDRESAYLMLRKDGTTDKVCAVDAKRIKTLHEKYPTVFNPVRFEALSPRSQLSAY
jgi:hypothetical protein